MKRQLSSSLSKMKFMKKEEHTIPESFVEQSQYIQENKTRLKRDSSFLSKDYVNGRMIFKKSKD